MRYDAPAEFSMFFGDYVIQDEIGRGGMKVVLKAHRVSTSETVALAVIRDRFPNEELQKRFHREAENMRELDHPNIVKILDHGTIASQPYIAMEFVEGKALSELLAVQSLNVQELLQIIVPICDAVIHAHSRGILHRDIKPENILVDPPNSPKLIDFGLAKDQCDVRNLTKPGQGLGTRMYVSPEQASGDLKQITEATDIYSIGVTIIQMALGTDRFINLFSDHRPSHVLTTMATGEFPQELLPICKKCVALKPEQRYADVHQLVHDLCTLQGRQGSTFRPYESTAKSKGDTRIAGVSHSAAGSQEDSEGIGRGTIIGGRYTLLSMLGRGAMGEVWKADADRRSHPVVIKFLPEILRNNTREMKRLHATFQLVNKLHHTNICPLYDFDEDPVAGVFLVMRYIEGIDLAQQCQRKQANNSAYSVTEACRTLLPLAFAIDEAHSKGVLHRDIKPANIMLSDEDGTPFLVDFGLAEQIRNTLTEIEPDRGISGTLEFLSPEVWQGHKPVAASDQYAFGVVAYMMLAGQPPYKQTGNMEVLRQRVISDAIPALNLAPNVNRVFRRVLHKQPGSRFSNCQSFVEALQACEKQSVATGRHWLSRTTSRLNPLILTLSLGVLLLLILGFASHVFTPFAKSSSDRQALAQAAFDRGLEFFFQKQWSAAISEFTAAIELKNDLPEVFAYRGVARLDSSENSQDREVTIRRALDDFRKAIELRFDFFDAFYGRGRGLSLLGELATQRGDNEEAKTYFVASVDSFSEALLSTPNNPKALHGRGMAYQRLQDYDKAIDDYTESLNADSKFAEAYESRASAYFHENRFLAAKRDYETALMLDPSKDDLRSHISDCDKMLTIADVEN